MQRRAGWLGEEHAAPAGFWVQDGGVCGLRRCGGGEGNADVPAVVVEVVLLLLGRGGGGEGGVGLRVGGGVGWVAGGVCYVEGDGWVAAWEGLQQEAVVFRFVQRSRAIAVLGVRETPVRREEERFLYARGAEDGMTEGATSSLGEEEVLGREVEEDLLEEFFGESGGLRRHGRSRSFCVFVFVEEGRVVLLFLSRSRCCCRPPKRGLLETAIELIHRALGAVGKRAQSER